MSIVCQNLTICHLLVLCHYIHCSVLQSVHSLSETHNLPSVGSVSLYSLYSSTVCLLLVSTSHCNVCSYCATMSTALLCSLSTFYQYLELYHLLILCRYVHCYILQFANSLSVHHTVPPVGPLSLCPLLSCTVCLLSVSISHFTMCWFCVTRSTGTFYSQSAVCYYLTINCLLNLCHYGHCCLLQSVHCLSLSHNELSVKSVSLWTLLSPTVCPLSVDNSQFTFFISVTL